MTAAIALGAFYSPIQRHVQLLPMLAQQWRNKRTVRYFPNLAVHPSGKIQAPLLHNEIDVCVKWRFAYFRAGNAKLIVNAATGMAGTWRATGSQRIVRLGSTWRHYANDLPYCFHPVISYNRKPSKLCTNRQSLTLSVISFD
jgi:hypothetical protein